MCALRAVIAPVAISLLLFSVLAGCGEGCGCGEPAGGPRGDRPAGDRPTYESSSATGENSEEGSNSEPETEVPSEPAADPALASAIALPIEDTQILAGGRPLGCELLHVAEGRVRRPEAVLEPEGWMSDLLGNGSEGRRPVPTEELGRIRALPPIYLWTPSGACRAQLGPLEMRQISDEVELSYALTGCGEAYAPLAASCPAPPPALRWVPIAHERIRRLRETPLPYGAPTGDALIDGQRRRFIDGLSGWQRELWDRSLPRVGEGELRIWHRSRLSTLRAEGLAEELRFLQIHWAFYEGERPHDACPEELFSEQGYVHEVEAHEGERNTPLSRSPWPVLGGLHDGRRFVAVIWEGVGGGEECDGAASCMLTRFAFRRRDDRFLAQARVAYDRTAGNLSVFGALAFSNMDCMP